MGWNTQLEWLGTGKPKVEAIKSKAQLRSHGFTISGVCRAEEVVH